MVDNFVFRFFLTGFAFLFLGCGDCASPGDSGGSSSLGDEGDSLHFVLPSIPSVISDVEGRREYLALHYWDNFDFARLDFLAHDSLMGVALGGYIQILTMTTPEVVAQSLDSVLSRSLSLGYDSFSRFTSGLEHYLYNPNSPVRNEDLYLCVLRFTVGAAALDDIYKVRSRSQLEMVLKNRVGDRAFDFGFVDHLGQSSTLYSLRSSYTILFFNTPDCDDCSRVKSYIGGSLVFTGMVDSLELTVLGVYTGSDYSLWFDSSYPSLILNTYDSRGDITRDRLYDLRALPTLYLLDQHKRVILKDCSIEAIDAYFCK